MAPIKVRKDEKETGYQKALVRLSKDPDTRNEQFYANKHIKYCTLHLMMEMYVNGIFLHNGSFYYIGWFFTLKQQIVHFDAW